MIRSFEGWLGAQNENEACGLAGAGWIIPPAPFCHRVDDVSLAHPRMRETP